MKSQKLKIIVSALREVFFLILVVIENSLKLKCYRYYYSTVYINYINTHKVNKWQLYKKKNAGKLELRK
jgi:hypothetical protein